jgi:pyruvate dehydrogenase E2 component (dihydrolipoamide acetyltransferase)
VKASPVARRLADEAGIDIERVQGSGPGGRVVKRDVEEAKEKGVAAPAGGPAHAGPEYEDVRSRRCGRRSPSGSSQSIGPVPTFYLTIDVDMGRVMEARKSINAMLEEEGRKVSINDLVLKATAGALADIPSATRSGTTASFAATTPCTSGSRSPSTTGSSRRSSGTRT